MKGRWRQDKGETRERRGGEAGGKEKNSYHVREVGFVSDQKFNNIFFIPQFVDCRQPRVLDAHESFRAGPGNLRKCTRGEGGGGRGEGGVGGGKRKRKRKRKRKKRGRGRGRRRRKRKRKRKKAEEEEEEGGSGRGTGKVRGKGKGRRKGNVIHIKKKDDGLRLNLQPSQLFDILHHPTLKSHTGFTRRSTLRQKLLLAHFWVPNDKQRDVQLGLEATLVQIVVVLAASWCHHATHGGNVFQRTFQKKKPLTN
jgi:hypothetical protein